MAFLLGGGGGGIKRGRLAGNGSMYHMYNVYVHVSWILWDSGFV